MLVAVQAIDDKGNVVTIGDFFDPEMDETTAQQILDNAYETISNLGFKPFKPSAMGNSGGSKQFTKDVDMFILSEVEQMRNGEAYVVKVLYLYSPMVTNDKGTFPLYATSTVFLDTDEDYKKASVGLGVDLDTVKLVSHDSAPKREISGTKSFYNILNPPVKIYGELRPAEKDGKPLMRENGKPVLNFIFRDWVVTETEEKPAKEETEE
jgi:hypothetical protein